MLQSFGPRVSFVPKINGGIRAVRVHSIVYRNHVGIRITHHEVHLRRRRRGDLLGKKHFAFGDYVAESNGPTSHAAITARHPSHQSKLSTFAVKVQILCLIEPVARISVQAIGIARLKSRAKFLQR